jgi:hypothetical protein
MGRHDEPRRGLIGTFVLMAGGPYKALGWILLAAMPIAAACYTLGGQELRWGNLPPEPPASAAPR